MASTGRWPGCSLPTARRTALLGSLTRAIYPADVVYSEQLQGSELDRYFSYTDEDDDAYWPGTIKFYDQANGPPDNDNLIRQPDIANGAVVVGVGTPRTDRRP